MLGGIGRYFQQGDALLRLRLPQGSAAAQMPRCLPQTPPPSRLPLSLTFQGSLATTQTLQANLNDQIAHHVLMQRTPYQPTLCLWLSKDVTICDGRQRAAQPQSAPTLTTFEEVVFHPSAW